MATATKSWPHLIPSAHAISVLGHYCGPSACFYFTVSETKQLYSWREVTGGMAGAGRQNMTGMVAPQNN